MKGKREQVELSRSLHLDEDALAALLLLLPLAAAAACCCCWGLGWIWWKDAAEKVGTLGSLGRDWVLLRRDRSCRAEAARRGDFQVLVCWLLVEDCFLNFA